MISQDGNKHELILQADEYSNFFLRFSYSESEFHIRFSLDLFLYINIAIPEKIIMNRMLYSWPSDHT
jgi:hypothetical protein